MHSSSGLADLQQQKKNKKNRLVTRRLLVEIPGRAGCVVVMFALHLISCEVRQETAAPEVW